MTSVDLIGKEPFIVIDGLDELTFDRPKAFTESPDYRHFSWVGTPELAGVSDQRPHNTCTAHALSRAHETLRRQTGAADAPLDADQFHQCVLGMHVSAGVTDVVTAVRTFCGTGAPAKHSSFKPGKPCPSPPRPRIVCKGAKRVSEAHTAKRAISEYRPIVALMSSETSFLELDDYSIFRDGNGPKSLHHAILIVGFDEDNECWEVQNSFGTEWGSGGRARIAYGSASLFSDSDHISFLLF